MAFRESEIVGSSQGKAAEQEVGAISLLGEECVLYKQAAHPQGMCVIITASMRVMIAVSIYSHKDLSDTRLLLLLLPLLSVAVEKSPLP